MYSICAVAEGGSAVNIRSQKITADQVPGGFFEDDLNAAEEVSGNEVDKF